MLKNAEAAPVETSISNFENSPAPELGNNNEEDKPREECGVFGVVSHREGAVLLAYKAALTQVNRGDQATGIGTYVDGKAMSVAGKGNAQVALLGGKLIAGHTDAKNAIAHNLYSTDDNTELQPVSSHGILLSHNGNVLNAKAIAKRYGITVTEDISDSGIIARAIGKQKMELGSIEAAVEEVAPRLSGAFSIVILDEDKLIALRDRVGYRPLVKGVLADGDGWTVASETPVFDMIDAESRGTVEPGTYEVITADGVQDVRRWAPSLHPEGKAMICGMELAYFARADGQIEEIDVADARERMGEFLAEDYPVEADMVMPYPDSGRQVANGINKVLKLVHRDGFYKNHISSKTYIQHVSLIKEALKIKLNPIRSAVRGRRIIAADDSIVRGNTTRDTVRAIRDAGATEMHLRIAHPPIKHPCHFGMNMKTEDGLLADGRTKEQMRIRIGANSLEFSTAERFAEAVGRDIGSLCMGCVTGKYPEDLYPEKPVEEKERVLAGV